MALDRTNELQEFIDRVTTAGGQQTPEFAVIVAGWSAPSPDPVALYTKGVIQNDAELMERAIALAPTKNLTPAELRARATNGVADALVAQVRVTARSNYTAAAAGFDESVKALADSHAIISVSATAEELAKPESTTKQRTAWNEQPALARKVQMAYERLAAAAALAGVQLGDGDGSVTETMRIPLVVDVSTASTRRALFDAWRDRSHRLGRWGALVAAGIALRAHDLKGFAPIEPERDLEVVRIQRGPGIRQVEWDPESDQPKPTA